jgi:hypothetical protein
MCFAPLPVLNDIVLTPAAAFAELCTSVKETYCKCQKRPTVGAKET